MTVSASRSRNMAAIRGRGNSTTELAMVGMLRAAGVRGWRRHVRIAGARPDFMFRRHGLAVFIDGCFWHGCPIHFSVPDTRREFWLNKIEGNIRRDARNRAALWRGGWKVLRVWEHDIKKSPDKAIARISAFLSQRLTS